MEHLIFLKHTLELLTLLEDTHDVIEFKAEIYYSIANDQYYDAEELFDYVDEALDADPHNDLLKELLDAVYVLLPEDIASIEECYV